MDTKKQIILSIGLLVSNRKDTIEKCLDSLAPIRKAIPTELIILDTGCDTDVREIIERYADKIDEFVWCKDFSKARNVTLDMAEGEWFLYLDDDEWFSKVDELIDFFVSGKYKNYGYASYIVRNYLDFEGTQYSDSWVARMIKKEADTRFYSKIHEYVSPQRGNHANLHVIAEHYGYVYRTEEEKQKHFERNYVLLKEMIKEEPTVIRWKMQLVQEFRTVEAFENMISYGKEYLKICDEGSALGCFYASIILGYAGLKDYTNVVFWCKKMQADVRVNRLANTFLELSLANALFYLGDFQASICSAEKYLEYDVYFKKNKEELYVSQRVPFVGEVFDEVKYKEIYSLLMCAGLKLNDVSYLEKYIHKLKWNMGTAYIFEGMMDTLIEAICKLGYRKEFLSTIKIIRNHKGINEYFNNKLIEWKENGFDVTIVENVDKFGIRLHMQKQYLEIVKSLEHVNLIIKKLIETQNVGQLTELLSQAQGVAISLGTAIENELGIGTLVVKCIEEYCELLWSISEVNGCKEKLVYIEKLNFTMSNIRREISDLPIKRIAVFLPYKASLWNLMEGMWKEAHEDNWCDEYVVPIPYLEKDEKGQFQRAYYEGNDFSDDVTVYNWEEFDLASIYPDRIVILENYDENNKEMSVYPNYYASVLKDFTHELKCILDKEM